MRERLKVARDLLIGYYGSRPVLIAAYDERDFLPSLVVPRDYWRRHKNELKASLLVRSDLCIPRTRYSIHALIVVTICAISDQSQVVLVCHTESHILTQTSGSSIRHRA